MPEHPPKDLAQLRAALKRSFDEDAEEVFELPRQEIQKKLRDKGIDPTKTLSKVRGLLEASRAQTDARRSNRIFLSHSTKYWSHPSVLKLNVEDPVSEILRRAERVVLEAMQSGWSGPPFDPVKLAHFRGVEIFQNLEVPDARILPSRGGKFRIEVNPEKGSKRTRFSIAHELAHTLFDDCGDVVRNRASKDEQHGNDWQLEMLCNLAASEFLMPFANFAEIKSAEANIDKVIRLQQTYDVSIEAVLLRFARLTEVECFVFTASQRKRNRFSIDYAVPSRTWKREIPPGTMLPAETRCADCIRVGFTERSIESWFEDSGKWEVQCLRISSLPGAELPRIAGLVKPVSPNSTTEHKLHIVRGDATMPRGSGPKIIAHIVNDKTPNWGRGFGFAIKQKWPEAQRRFRDWALQEPQNLSLGNVFFSAVSPEPAFVFQMICQHGYGPSPTPRVRYSHLKECLEKLARFAIEEKASVHMPKIGVGEAGGAWWLIQQMLDEVICAKGVPLTIYELPGKRAPAISEPELFD